MPLDPRKNFKDYLGDGAFASFDGFQIWITTEDGYQTTNAIALEPGVFRALVDYEKRLRMLLTAPSTAENQDG